MLSSVRSTFKVIILFMFITAIAACTSNSNTVDQTLTQPTLASQNGGQQPVPANGVGTDPNAPQQQASLDPNAAGQTQATGYADPNAAATTPVSNNLGPNKAISYLPVEGAPQSAVTNLSKSLQSSAKTHGIELQPPSTKVAKYLVKGYFSALNDGNGTLLVYIWDITDRNGKRLHRINGKERTNSRQNDPWQAISSKEISRIADNTSANIRAWIEKQG